LRRASTLAAVLAAASGLLLADAVSAQSSPRHLSWPGRAAAPTPEAAPASPPAAQRADVRRPNPVIPHGGFTTAQPVSHGLTPAPGPARRTLTPANAWLRPAPMPAAPAPAPAAPVMAPAVAPTPPPPPPPPAAVRPVPEYLPDQGGRGQPAPAEVVYPAAAPVAEAAVDPMAPRRDAPIFRLQQTPPAPAALAPAVASAPAADAPPVATTAVADRSAPQPRLVQVVNSGEAPPRAEGGRYYSVHRLNGREPDALVMPEPTYVDGLVVSNIDTLASQDLAAPEPGPTLIRDRNGNLRAAPAASDGDHQ